MDAAAGERLADFHDVGKLPTVALPSVDEQDDRQDLQDAQGDLDGDADEEGCG